MRSLAFVAAVILVMVLFIGALYAVRAETPVSALASPAASATATAAATATVTATTVPTPGFAVPKTSGELFNVACGVIADNPTKTGAGSAPNTFVLRSLAGEQVVVFGWPSGLPLPTLGSYMCGRFIGGAPFLGLTAFVRPGDADYLPPTYVNKTYKFSVVLPEPYRRSDKLSFSGLSAGHPAAQDAFTARTPEDDAIAAADTHCETACAVWNYVAHVVVFTDVPTQTPRQWFDAGGAGHAVGETTADITIDGRSALKVINGAGYPVQYIVADRGRMFSLAYTLRTDQPAPAGASKEKLDAILASFKFVP